MVKQIIITMPSFKRGYHLVTGFIVERLTDLPETGIVSLFINHTSAALTINENADPTVRLDFESFMNRMVPEGSANYLHSSEGPDDMPAHIKSSLLGPEITIPVSNGRLDLGTWQGIYLCEFRDHGGPRKITATILG